jgi:hypothetical protein
LWVEGDDNPASAGDLVGALEDLTAGVLDAVDGGVGGFDIDVVEPVGRGGRYA